VRDAPRRPGVLRLRIEQFAPQLGEPAANLERLARSQTRAAAEGIDLVVTPELSLTGYDIRDRSHALAEPLGELPFPQLAHGPDMILGMVERGAGFVPFNTAVHIRRGRVLHRHRKVYLPTYGMFDEARHFGAGDRVRAYSAGFGDGEDWRVGLLVCEDLWHPALSYLLAAAGAHLLIVQSAAAGRGTWQGRGAAGEGGRFASWETWEHLARAAAVAYGTYVVLANRVGVEGPCVFAGGSLVVAPDGIVEQRADDFAEQSLTAELRLDRVAAARRPFSHLRDDDPHLVLRELNHLLQPDA
jgi:predicted amidohydrolase